MPCLQSTTLAHAAMAALSWLKRGRLVSAVSRSTGDLLKALQQQNGQHQATGQHERGHRKGSKGEANSRLGVIKTGYLYVMTDAGFWFRMWVVLRVGRLETYYESSDSIPMETVSLGGGQLATPRAISSDCPEDVLYPMHVFKDGQTSICLAAESPDEQRRWAEALRGSLQASSLDMEGLNLEGHGGRNMSIGEPLSTDLGEDVRGRVFKKLDLLDELLAQRDAMHAPNDPKVKELCQKLEGLDQWYERVLISEQNEALRRATHLRQRKISTQLKADTIREQLRSSRKSRPKMATLSFRESPRNEDQDAPSSFYEGQLRELTDQLNLIHSSLGREEAHSETASRKLVRKHDHEIHRLHSDLDLLQRKVPGTHPKIQVSRSQEDCRIDPRLRNTGHDRITRDKNASSMMELSRTTSNPITKNRLSPLRLLSQLVDVRRRRCGGTGSRNASEELLPHSRGDSEELASMEEEEAASYQRSKRSSDSSNSSSTSSEKLRTEIDPSALREIQAFELMTEQVLASARPSRRSSVAE